MLLTKPPFITRTYSIGCELPLLGRWGVLCFSEWTQLLNFINLKLLKLYSVNPSRLHYIEPDCTIPNTCCAITNGVLKTKQLH